MLSDSIFEKADAEKLTKIELIIRKMLQLTDAFFAYPFQ